MFKDATSGETTYAPGRFLDTDMPKDGIVVLDFNQAYNPPCAFTAFATCPLPPKQNTLTIAVEAGEKKYGDSPCKCDIIRLVLASRSPRRAELLTAAEIPFIIRAADIDETPSPGEVSRAIMFCAWPRKRLAPFAACRSRDRSSSGYDGRAGKRDSWQAGGRGRCRANADGACGSQRMKC